MPEKIISNFEKMYAGPQHPIDALSPELHCLNLICEGKLDEAFDLFAPSPFGKAAWVDAPQGRFEGDDIRAFLKGFVTSFSASEAYVTPAVQTVGGGRSVTELVLYFLSGDEWKYATMAAVADRSHIPGKMESLRLYFNYKWAPGFNAYRAPIFDSIDHNEIDRSLLTGCVREYFEGLHTMPAADVDRLLASMDEGCIFGGYGYGDHDLHVPTREELRTIYEGMSSYIPRRLLIRIQTIIDDGVNCVVEWQHIISKDGRDEAYRLAEAGISAYERGKNGKLIAIRICDYANCEGDIDWATARNSREYAEKFNYTGDSFPGVKAAREKAAK